MNDRGRAGESVPPREPYVPSGQLAAPSTWAPLRYPVLLALWIASVAANVGTWMHNVGEWYVGASFIGDS
jgi:hypothetical protein